MIKVNYYSKTFVMKSFSFMIEGTLQKDVFKSKLKKKLKNLIDGDWEILKLWRYKTKSDSVGEINEEDTIKGGWEIFVTLSKSFHLNLRIQGK